MVQRCCMVSQEKHPADCLKSLESSKVPSLPTCCVWVQHQSWIQTSLDWPHCGWAHWNLWVSLNGGVFDFVFFSTRLLSLAGLVMWRMDVPKSLHNTLAVFAEARAVCSFRWDKGRAKSLHGISAQMNEVVRAALPAPGCRGCWANLCHGRKKVFNYKISNCLIAV